VWPLCGSGGEGGSRVPLAIGWEVPVRSRRSASGSGTKRTDVFEAGDKATVHTLFCSIECTRVYDEFYMCIGG
jgi:hypothetical protein